jgi:cytochrome c553
MNSATAFATSAATLRPLVQYGEQQDKEATVMKCGNCHGADGNGAWLLAARAAADFAK